MREIHVDNIIAAVAQLAIQANCSLPDELVNELRQHIDNEPSPIGKDVLQQLMENATLAVNEQKPVCQDTGLAVVFAELGQDVHIIGGSFEEAIHQGVARGYQQGYLRKSVVAEPLFERKNTQDNTPAMLHTRLVPGDRLHLCLAPKGAGSENKGALAMLVPADGLVGVKRFVVETVKKAGASPCPPMVVGVGIGGTMELACLYAKKASVRSVTSAHPDPRYAELEQDLLQLINKLGIGPQGLGGRTTAYAVNIECGATHIACLPVAVNINCNAARHAEMTI